MARRNDLAGLAALGALGLLLNKKQDGSSVPVEDRVGTPVGGDDQYNPDVRAVDRNEDYGNEGRREGPVGIGRMPRSNAAPARTRPSTYTPKPGSAGQKGPGFGEEAAYRQQQYEEAQRRAASPEGRAERQRMEQSQALEAVRPEEYLLGGSMMGLKGVASAAQNLARRHAARNVEKIPEYIQPAIGYSDRARLAYSGGDQAVKGATKQLPGPPRQIAYEAADTARDKVTNPLAWLAGPKGMDEFKKGGKVKKAAPARSSASSRGDGIAKRGKTRGRMF
jgi:hypothetical protein